MVTGGGVTVGVTGVAVGVTGVAVGVTGLAVVAVGEGPVVAVAVAVGEGPIVAVAVGSVVQVAVGVTGIAVGVTGVAVGGTGVAVELYVEHPPKESRYLSPPAKCASKELMLIVSTTYGLVSELVRWQMVIRRPVGVGSAAVCVFGSGLFAKTVCGGKRFVTSAAIIIAALRI